MSYTAFTPNAATPSSTPPDLPFQNLSSFASITALKAVPTLGTAGTDFAVIGQQARVAHALGGYTIWQLISGTHADSPSTGFAQPSDYNAVSNQKYWQQINYPN